MEDQGKTLGTAAEQPCTYLFPEPTCHTTPKTWCFKSSLSLQIGEDTPVRLTSSPGKGQCGEDSTGLWGRYTSRTAGNLKWESSSRQELKNLQVDGGQRAT